MGNGKSEMRTQVMKMPIPTSEFALPPSLEKLLASGGLRVGHAVNPQLATHSLARLNYY